MIKYEVANKDTINNLTKDYPPLASEDEIKAIDDFYNANPELKQIISNKVYSNKYYLVGSYEYKQDADWIQTYSGRRFNPLDPNYEAIVIQDIAHPLAMQCRFTGHSKEFYSVAQHSVYVSYICNFEDALYGLLHDASEAYLVDIPRPLKRSGKLNGYLEFESKMQDAVNKRFSLEANEPSSVKKADKMLLATEARDLMSPLHETWVQSEQTLPFNIIPWSPKEAESQFVKRFYQLLGDDQGYKLYYNMI